MQLLHLPDRAAVIVADEIAVDAAATVVVVAEIETEVVAEIEIVVDAAATVEIAVVEIAASELLESRAKSHPLAALPKFQTHSQSEIAAEMTKT